MPDEILEGLVFVLDHYRGTSLAVERPRKNLPVALALDYYLIVGVGQPIQRAVPWYGFVEEAEPLLHSPVAGDDKAGNPVAIEDELVEVGGLLGGEAAESQAVQDQ